MARGWKRGAEWLLATSGVAGLRRRMAAPSTVILAYHDIVPHGEPTEGDASLHVDQGAFADQLDFLLESHDVVPLDGLREASAGPPDRPRAVLTFDDAYLGTMTAGVDELEARGLPATVFVPPGLLGSDGFWWDRLAPPGGHPLPAALRAHALQRLQGRQDRVVKWARESDLPLADLPPHTLPADEGTLIERAAAGRVTLAPHTWSHPNLAVLARAEVADELDRSRSWLQTRSPRYTDWLAYPYGLHDDVAVGEVSCRFQGAVLVEGGLAQERGRWAAPAHITPRLHVPRGLTLDGLALRLAGFLR